MVSCQMQSVGSGLVRNRALRFIISAALNAEARNGYKSAQGPNPDSKPNYKPKPKPDEKLELDTCTMY